MPFSENKFMLTKAILIRVECKINFIATAPGETWVGDLSYIWTVAGELY